jgi:cholesterol oxidase
MNRRIPVHTLAGVPDADISTHWLNTDDGLSLSLFRFTRGGDGDAVLLVHGHTLSSDMFIMPEHHNLVSYLLDNGVGEVWTFDSRISNRYSYNTTSNRFTLDDVAHYDFPPAVATVRAVIGDRPLHVVSHCVGALTLLMSMAAGLVNGFSTVVINSVGLIPRIPAWALAKIIVAPPVLETIGVPFLNPRWGTDPRFTPGWWVGKAVSMFHGECDDEHCHMLSFMWGAGRPAMFRHENILDETHERLADLCGPTPTGYDKHIRKMVFAGRAVKWDDREQHRDLPADYLTGLDRLDLPLLLLTGKQNGVFVDSAQVFHERLRAEGHQRAELRELPGYGHMDPFVGAHAALDVFPHILEFLKRPAA